MRWQTSLWWMGIWVSAVAAHAQSGANITLQLPSFSQFGVDTTVIVPDGGAAALAGDRAAAASGDRFGPRRGSRAVGIARSASQVEVTARIHDPLHSDRQLSAAVRRPSSRVPLAESLSARGGTSDGSPPRVAELTARRAADEAAQDRKARELFDKGRRSQAAGRNSLAATYYRTSAGQASEKLRREIHAQWRTLAATPTDGETASSDP